MADPANMLNRLMRETPPEALAGDSRLQDRPTLDSYMANYGAGSPDPMLERNRDWSKGPPSGSFLTQLTPSEEAQFQQWVNHNNVPFDPSPQADYDMRGFWKAAQAGDPRASTAINPNDGQIHFGDYWKTPYHESFSNESQWAAPGAPSWVNDSQLATPSGRVVFDERASNGR